MMNGPEKSDRAIVARVATTEGLIRYKLVYIYISVPRPDRRHTGRVVRPIPFVLAREKFAFSTVAVADPHPRPLPRDAQRRGPRRLDRAPKSRDHTSVYCDTSAELDMKTLIWTRGDPLGSGPVVVGRLAFETELEGQPADSDEVARVYRFEVARGFRDDVAHLSDLMSPGGEAFWPVGSLASGKPLGQSGIAA